MYYHYWLESGIQNKIKTQTFCQITEILHFKRLNFCYWKFFWVSTPFNMKPPFSMWFLVGHTSTSGGILFPKLQIYLTEMWSHQCGLYWGGGGRIPIWQSQMTWKERSTSKAQKIAPTPKRTKILPNPSPTICINLTLTPSPQQKTVDHTR